jgi:hypothetical protein
MALTQATAVLVDELDLKSSMLSSAPSIKLGSFCEFRLRLALPLSLFQSNPRAPTILVDELDAGEL